MSDGWFKTVSFDGVARPLPLRFFCTLTGKLMGSPVLAADGKVYERQAISEWMNRNDISPATGKPFGTKMVVTAVNVVLDMITWIGATPVADVRVLYRGRSVVSVTLPLTDRIAELKRRVARAVNIAPKDQLLIYGDTVIDDDSRPLDDLRARVIDLHVLRRSVSTMATIEEEPE